jgi:MoaA/NifB/PqqE/SkfB family radical SAM enzyme
MQHDAQSDLSIVHPVNESIRGVFRDAMVLREPKLLPFLTLTYLRQKAASRRRLEWEEAGLHVPPFMILSVTERCNLACKGCYAQAHGRQGAEELSGERLERLFCEAEELGISLVILAGGEPLLRRDLLELTASHPQIVFPLFTNGTMIDDEVVAALRGQRHVVPIVSIEGLEQETDERRGEGVYGTVIGKLDALRAAGIFSGVSLTVTYRNLDLVTSRDFVKGIVGHGSRLLFYIEYVAVREGIEELELTPGQREKLERRLRELHAEREALFVSFPGDEKRYGGCLAAGRGFVHVSASGLLEPCPLAPYSDSSLRELPLREALRSELLRKIRGSREHLAGGRGACALVARREWLQSLLASGEAATA